HNSTLHHRFWDGSAWHDENVLGTQTAVDTMRRPAVTAWGPQHLDVFWGDTASTGRHVQFDPMYKYWPWYYPTGWAPEQVIEGNFPNETAAASWGPTRIDLFGIGPGGWLQHQWWNQAGGPNGTESFHDPSGTSVKPGTNPAVASWGPYHLDLF